ncbi:glycosyltransferase [uncultured Prevotella sp.]|uniref:glycosyltransferase family protein n=1 Tax=uncultured Prevotella sp. TaxID=159272 RepID=UPI00266BEBAD|nr:glycosyltransferase [uncultured Prevotella sp.]
MKILLITAEEWNDYVYGNGVLTNWFTGFDAEFAQIYTSPGSPSNKVCNKYFQIDERQMVKSLYSHYKAGHEIEMPTNKQEQDAAKCNAQRKGIYGIFKKLSLWMHTPIVMLQDFIWMTGRYDKAALQRFIDGYKPDVVFCPQLGNPKMWRLEKLVTGMTDVPFVAFTGDDEASYQQVSKSPLFWLRRWYCHNGLKNSVKIFSHYFMHSKEQAQDYTNEYGVPTSTLYKCGDFSNEFVKKSVGSPIRLVYAGRLYCNRWKTLAEIGKALHEINKHGERMVLDIYTQEALTNEQRKALSPENSVYMKGSVNPQQLKEVYRNADIALHVESMDKKNRLATRVSFSTKIIDLMASSCAILAVCWNRHCGYQYLRDNDAAFCVDNYSDILPMLQRIVDNPSLVQNYAQKAYECGRKNHTREKIQKQIRDKFEELIAKRQANE